MICHLFLLFVQSEYFIYWTQCSDWLFSFSVRQIRILYLLDTVFWLIVFFAVHPIRILYLLDTVFWLVVFIFCSSNQRLYLLDTVFWLVVFFAVHPIRILYLLDIHISVPIGCFLAVRQIRILYLLDTVFWFRLCFLAVHPIRILYLLEIHISVLIGCFLTRSKQIYFQCFMPERPGLFCTLIHNKENTILTWWMLLKQVNKSKTNNLKIQIKTQHS